jgi:hypothetical protein
MVLGKSMVVDKLRSIHSMTARKQQLEQKRLSTKAKMAAATSYPNSSSGSSIGRSGLHRIAPAWALRRDTVHTIEDPLVAVNFMMTSLNIVPK